MTQKSNILSPFPKTSNISITAPKSPPHPSPPAQIRSLQTSASSTSVSSQQLLSTSLQPGGVVPKRKSSFSEMRTHETATATNNQRQSSLDLQKSSALLAQRKSAQFSISPLSQQQTTTGATQSWIAQDAPNKIPRVELPAGQAIGDSHPSAYFSTTLHSGANISGRII